MWPFRHKVETTYKQRANRKPQNAAQKKVQGKTQGRESKTVGKKSIISGVRKISEFPRLVFSEARSWSSKHSLPAFLLFAWCQSAAQGTQVMWLARRSVCICVLLHYTHLTEEMWLCFLSVFEFNKLCSNKFKIWKQKINLSVNVWYGTRDRTEKGCSADQWLSRSSSWCQVGHCNRCCWTFPIWCSKSHSQSVVAGDWTETPEGTWDTSHSDKVALCLQDIFISW